MFSRPKILFLVSLLFVALLNSIPTYLNFYHSSLHISDDDSVSYTLILTEFEVAPCELEYVYLRCWLIGSFKSRTV